MRCGCPRPGLHMLPMVAGLLLPIVPNAVSYEGASARGFVNQWSAYLSSLCGAVSV